MPARAAPGGGGFFCTHFCPHTYCRRRDRDWIRASHIAGLTSRNIPTPRGGDAWNAMSVMRAMKRLRIADGYFHIDIAELQTAEGKLYLYVAIDRTSKFAFIQLVRKTGRTSVSAFLEALIAAVHTVLTDNGIQFTFPPRYAYGPTRCATHMFDMRCQENGIRVVAVAARPSIHA